MIWDGGPFGSLSPYQVAGSPCFHVIQRSVLNAVVPLIPAPHSVRDAVRTSRRRLRKCPLARPCRPRSRRQSAHQTLAASCHRSKLRRLGGGGVRSARRSPSWWVPASCSSRRPLRSRLPTRIHQAGRIRLRQSWRQYPRRRRSGRHRPRPQNRPRGRRRRSDQLQRRAQHRSRLLDPHHVRHRCQLRVPRLGRLLRLRQLGGSHPFN
jgi:hypothetical protein